MHKALRVAATGTIAAMAFATGMQQASAADWSDTSIGYRYGTKFAEPFNPKDIEKNIVNVTHASGNKYGSDFFNVDFLESDGTDAQAQEAYVTYRHTFDIGAISGSPMKFGPVRGVGVTAGFDWNTKNDPGYASKKHMAVVGPTLMLDVPGFLNVSVLALWESNKPVGIKSRYSYDTHAMLTASWGIPLGHGFSFEGFANYIASKGKDEFGGGTKPETNFDGQIMYDLSPSLSMKPGSLKAGFEYQYWRNKFGNNAKGFAGSGAFAKTPMIRAEYHF